MATKFQQWVNAFDGTTTETSCTVTIDSAGVITSTIAAALDTSDQATENITSNLPTGEEGRVRFYYTPPSAWTPGGNLNVLHIEQTPASGEIVELYLDTNKVLAVFSRAGRLHSAGLNGGAGPMMADGVEHLIEVAWKKNAFLKVWVDGALTFNNTSLSGAGSSAVPALVTVGIHHYDGAGGGPITAKYRLFQLADTATDTLGDPSGSIPVELTKVLDKLVGPGMWGLLSLDSVSTSTALEAQRLEELLRVCKVNNYELRFSGGTLIASPKR